MLFADATEAAKWLNNVLANSPRFDSDFASSEIPQNGIYVFFEQGETVEIDGETVDRVVRIGTHRADRRLRRRLRQHFRGNTRASVFRRHIGTALLASQKGLLIEESALPLPAELRLPEVERSISAVLEDQFTFTCLPVENVVDRLRLESGLIALFALHPPGAPTEAWLGRHAIRHEIRSCGLWNTQHITGEPVGWDDLKTLAQSLPNYPVPGPLKRPGFLDSSAQRRSSPQ